MRRNIRILSLIAVSMLLLPMLSFVMVFAEGESATMVCLRSGEPLYGSDKINVCKTINADEDGNYIVKVVDDVDTDGGDEYRADEDGYNTSPIGVYINGTFFGKTLENAKNYIVIFSDGGNGTSVPILSKQLKDGDVSFTYNVSDYTLTESDGSVTPYDPNTFEELAKTSDEFIDMSEYGPLTISVIEIGGSGDGVETCNYEDDSGSSKFLLNFSDTNGNAYRVGELTGSDYYVELNYYDDLGGGKHQIGTCNIPADAKSVRVIIKDKNNETLFDAAAPDDTSSWTIDFGQYVDENGRIVAHIVAVDGDGETEAKTEEELNQQAYDDMNLSTCESSGAAQSLGWIVCPIMEWMASAAEQIYTDYVEPSLRIEPQLLTGGANATQNAWETFRNIANVVFIIFFMVVIFSQLTGVGIDNYGIKKVLPKLIVIAILVNLSFLICQICVDLSNILGNGLQAMFDSFASNFGNLEISGIEGATEPVAATGGAISAVVILGGVLGVAGLVFNPAMIVTLLIAALGVVISILFLFALLAARQAAVVVLILLSPLALVCYILPNMKKMFDKWLKLWEAMLLLYPICGLLVGGANYVSKLLIYTGMGSQGLFGAFTAMIVGVVPIFFIPTLVKGAFSAMGKLGGTLAGMGARASGATKKYTRSTGGAIAKKVGSTDTYRSIRNAIGRHSLTKRGRARAVTDTAALMSERAKRERLADRSGMDRRFQSIAAAEEAKASDEATSQALSLMMSSGEGGGIKMKDGSRKTYTLDNATARMKELESDARGRELTNAEQLEMAALARGMSNMKGGAGKLSGIIRGAEVTDPSTGVKSANGNFMKVMGEIYSRDSAVQAKMNEKDMSASIYTEHFMAGGDGLASDPASRFTSTFATESATAGHQNAVGARVKSHAAGLNQSGAAFDEYLDRLNNSANPAASYQEILDDDSLMNSLDATDRDKVRQAAANKGVTGKTAQFVGEAMYDNISGGSAQKLMEYSDGTLRDAAGNRYDRTNWKKTMAKVVGEATYQDSKGMRVNLMQMDDGSLQDEFGKTYDRTKWTKV